MKITRGRDLQRGQAMVESALALTVFLMFIFGILEFGRAVWAYNQVAYLSHDGARYAIVHGSASPQPATAAQIATYVQNAAIGLPPAAVSVTTAWAPDNSPGSQVSVRVQYTVQFLGPFMPASSLPVSATSRMIISQ